MRTPIVEWEFTSTDKLVLVHLEVLEGEIHFRFQLDSHM